MSSRVADSVKPPTPRAKIVLARSKSTQDPVLRERLGEIFDRYIDRLERVSRPGLRVYTKADGIPRVLGGMGIVAESGERRLLAHRADHGILDGHEHALEALVEVETVVHRLEEF